MLLNEHRTSEHSITSFIAQQMYVLEFAVDAMVRWRCLRNMPRVLPFQSVDITRRKQPLHPAQLFHGFTETMAIECDRTVTFTYVPRPETICVHGVYMISRAWDTHWATDDTVVAARNDAIWDVTRQWHDPAMQPASGIATTYAPASAQFVPVMTAAPTLSAQPALVASTATPSSSTATAAGATTPPVVMTTWTGVEKATSSTKKLQAEQAKATSKAAHDAASAAMEEG